METQRDLGDMVVEVTSTRFFHFSVPEYWQPAVNAFRCNDKFIVCVDLAGLEKREIDLKAEPRRLIIRGTRLAAEPRCDPPALQVLALEIDHGPFERVLDLPDEIDPDRVKAEQRNGLVWIHLPLRNPT